MIQTKIKYYMEESVTLAKKVQKMEVGDTKNDSDPVVEAVVEEVPENKQATTTTKEPYNFKQVEVGGETRFMCATCGKICEKEQSVKSHITRVHGTNKKQLRGV